MHLLAAMAALAAVEVGQAPPPAAVAQTVDPTPRFQIADGVATVDDVVVTGGRLDTVIREFVGEVAYPARNRGLARWHREVCVGTVNMSADHARYMVDRVSDVASSIGLRPGAPGCRPDIVIIAARDGQKVASDLVASRQQFFNTRIAELLGIGSVRAFQEPGRPVRWWLSSLPVDRLGRAAVALGDFENFREGGIQRGVLRAPPVVYGADASILRLATRDDLTRAIVIIDANEIGRASLEQLADYVAMVSLVQIDPSGDTTGFPTILNLFDDPDQAPPGLTEWDLTYMQSLYNVTLNQVARGAQVRSIASNIAATRRASERD